MGHLTQNHLFLHQNLFFFKFYLQISTNYPKIKNFQWCFFANLIQRETFFVIISFINKHLFSLLWSFSFMKLLQNTLLNIMTIIEMAKYSNG
ncbi:unnamed protein product [Blepharisma stoltei]|uniref:Uncharacterized protein n=1 Tax=Blepharisma stoltei TaxID=1481888 RepID=A0AAU9KPT6_9CILI|nr:unnamed protein product [Blepharisma stoltei]